MTTLIVAPHFDDESISCGGLIAKRFRQGESVSLFVPYGRHYPGEHQFTSFMTEQDDFWAALAILSGCHDNTDLAYGPSRTLGLEEGEPGKTGFYRVLESLEVLLETVQPTEVIGPASTDLNQDHKHLHHLVSIALRSYSLSQKPFRRLSFHALDGRPYKPNWFEVLHPSDLQLKVDAVQAYKREQREPPHPRSPDKIRALAEVVGSWCNADLAEAYTLEYCVQ